MNQPSGMKKGIGFISLFCIAIGVIVGQTTIVSLLQAAGMAGWGFLGAMAIAYVLMLCNSATFAELALMMPHHGGLAAYCEASLGRFPAIFAGFAGYVVPALCGQAAELMLVDSVMSQLLPGVMVGPPLLPAQKVAWKSKRWPRRLQRKSSRKQLIRP